MKNKIVDAINTWKANPENKLCKWTLAEDIKEKHRAKILNGFGADIPFEKWVAVYDNTLVNNGKKGILFTKDKLILEKGREIVLDQVEAAYEVNVLQFIVKEKDGTYRYYKSKSGIREAIPILQLLNGMSQAKMPPKDEYIELHSTYRRELRRRMNQVTKELCAKNNRFISIEMADEAFIQNALVRWPQVDRNKIVAFLSTTYSSGKEAIIFTEDAIYAGTSKLVELSLDGLMRVRQDEEGMRYALYKNHYVNDKFFFIYASDKVHFYELIDRYYSIFEELKKEIEDGQVSLSGLELTDGLDQYLGKREEHLIQTYRNAVFVSSTFRDMHYERDAIHEKVQPALSALADKYGESISFCDLRWGVNTENLDSEAGAKKVLVVCLDEIEKCDPYMLIMLGERYGWIPKEQTIKNALEHRTEVDLDELEKSVTALEIEFGALSKRANKDKIFVYFREMKHLPSQDYASEDDRHREKLHKLKERVQKLVPDRVKTYELSWDEQRQSMDGVDIFAQMVIEDIGTVMEQVWSQKEKLEPFAQEVQKHLTYMKQKASQCFAREQLLRDCLCQLEDGVHLLALRGVSGCGKSTVMGALGASLLETSVNVLPIFCGLTKQTESALSVVKHICYYLEEQLQMPHVEDEKTEEYWLDYQMQLVEAYSKNCTKPLMILMDAIDQLSVDHIRNNLKFIPDNVDRLNSKVYIILSCLSEFELASFPGKIDVPLLLPDKKELVIQGILKRSRRELDAAVVKKIMEKQASDTPLYLTLLIQRLLMMNKNDFVDIMADGDGMSAITKHQLSLIADAKEDIPGICKGMIEVSADRIGGDFVKRAIAYLSLSKHGLRESDLEGLITADGVHWNRLEFSLFMNYLRNIFQLHEDGCYDFSHKVFRQIFTYEEEEGKELHRNMFHWIEQLPEKDPLREAELLEHCMAARESQAFIHHIARWMKEEKDTKELTQKLLDLCREDECNWLIQMIRLIENNQMTGENVQLFFDYVFGKIGRAFTSSALDLKLREKLYLETQPVVEYLIKEEGGFDNERRMCVILSQLGNVNYLNNDYGVAEVYFKKALDAGILLVEKYPIEKAMVELSINYRVLANTCHKIGDNVHDEMALSYYENCIQLGEDACLKYPDSVSGKRILGWNYYSFGNYYLDKGQDEKSISCYQKCINIRRNIVDITSELDDMISLASIVKKLGDYHYKKDDDKATIFYEECVIYREKIYQLERTTSNMESLAYAYNDLGYMYYTSTKEEYKSLVLPCYEKSIPLMEEMLSHKWDENLCWHLADDYRFCMEMLGNNQDVDSRKKLMQYAHRASELYERRALDLNTEDAYWNWLRMLNVYSAFAEGHAEKCAVLEKKILIHEVLYDITKVKKYKMASMAVKAALGLERGTGKL